MLVLTRKCGQSLWIGDAKVTVRVAGNRVRVAIDAPDFVNIRRCELDDKESAAKTKELSQASE